MPPSDITQCPSHAPLCRPPGWTAPSPDVPTLTSTPPSDVPNASMLPSALTSKHVHGSSDTRLHNTSRGNAGAMEDAAAAAPPLLDSAAGCEVFAVGGAEGLVAEETAMGVGGGGGEAAPAQRATCAPPGPLSRVSRSPLPSRAQCTRATCTRSVPEGRQTSSVQGQG